MSDISERSANVLVVLKGALFWLFWMTTFSLEALIVMWVLSMLLVGALMDSVSASPVLVTTVVGLNMVVLALSGVACGWTGGLLAYRFGLVRDPWWLPVALGSTAWLGLVAIFFPPSSSPVAVAPGAPPALGVALLIASLIVSTLIACSRALSAAASGTTGTSV